MTENKGDLISREALKEKLTLIKLYNGVYCKAIAETDIDNAPTVEYPFYQEAYQTGYEEGQNEIPQSGCKDCDECEDKAKQYSMGFQDGYLTGGFQLAELRRWLIAQGYSEGTVDDKIEDFQGFLKRVREDEG